MGRDPSEARYPAVLAEMTAEDFRRLGEKYLADTQAYRTGKRFFIAALGDALVGYRD
jgi:hypothetical protein